MQTLIVKETRKVVKVLEKIIHAINWSKIVRMLRKLWFNLAYYQKPPWDTGVSPPELLEFIADHNPGKALDLGCGSGTNSITLASHGWNVVGVDFAARAIHLAKKKARKGGVSIDFHLDNVTSLQSVNGKFDLILDIGCFHTLPPEKRCSYILNINQLLTDNGTYLLYVFFKENSHTPGPGVTPEDITFVTHNQELVERRDGTERGFRPSAWFILHKKLTIRNE